MVVDYGDYSRDLYVIMHGTVGIEIPNKNHEIPLHNAHECKLLTYIYCIQNFQKVAWKVMQDEIAAKKPFDLSA